jgi:hypothetical protein
MSDDESAFEPDPAWLETREGVEWLLGSEGEAWSMTPAARQWFAEEAPESFFEALGQHGFERYFAGQMRPPPEGWLTPETAPKIGSRVRFTGDRETLGGANFKDGELAFVAELHLTANGGVRATLRTPDGRKTIVLTGDNFSPA